ncbi:MAG TPA: ferredoxin [Bacteroidales bacterium]|nr:ferredoxin [Bacteroidales bacterium]
MAIKKVWMEEGCTSCGLCADICPDVFEIQDIAVVKNDVDYTAHSDEIKDAAEGCPVEIIKYEE